MIFSQWKTLNIKIGFTSGKRRKYDKVPRRIRSGLLCSRSLSICLSWKVEAISREPQARYWTTTRNPEDWKTCGWLLLVRQPLRKDSSEGKCRIIYHSWDWTVFYVSWGTSCMQSTQWKRFSSWRGRSFSKQRLGRYIGLRKPPRTTPAFCTTNLC